MSTVETHWAEAEVGGRTAVYLGTQHHPLGWIPAREGGEWPEGATALVADLDHPETHTIAALLAEAPRGTVVALRAELDGPSPRALVQLARGRTRAIALRDAGGATVLVAERGEPAGWPEVANDARLVTLTEARLEAVHAANAATLFRARQLSLQAMRSALKNDKARRADLDRLQNALRIANRSAKMKLGNAIFLATQNPKDALRLPKRVARIYRERGQSTAAPTAEDPSLAARARLERAFDRYLDKVRELQPERFVFLFSGTTFIQPLRANRPIRQARLLLERGVPVYFSYHGGMLDEAQPSFEHELLLETPVDFTADILSRLARADLGATKKVFIVSYPHLAPARHLDIFNAHGWATLYDCRDDWEAFCEVGAAKWYRGSIERFVVNGCDASFCVSGPLRDKIAGMSLDRPVEVSPNGYDAAFLSPGYVHAPTDPPKIGYFGHLSDKWFDWPSLARIARERPNYVFEIIGHLGPKTVDVPSNVHLLGPKTHAEICRIAAAWRVAIIPFQMGTLADAVDPIKIYEYFALGLPVVSFRMPQIDRYPATRTVTTVPDFVDALDAAIANPPDPVELHAFLEHNTWGHRVDQLLAAADRALASPRIEKTFHVSRGER